MSKKMKLNLEDLKVESFVTSLDNKEKEEIKAGQPPRTQPGWTGQNYCQICVKD